MKSKNKATIYVKQQQKTSKSSENKKFKKFCDRNPDITMEWM